MKSIMVRKPPDPKSAVMKVPTVAQKSCTRRTTSITITPRQVSTSSRSEVHGTPLAFKNL